MSVMAELSIFPLDRGPSLSAQVAKAMAVIRDSGLPYRLGPMGTCLEGEWDQVMAVVGQCFAVMKEDSQRLYLTLKVDYRQGRENGLEGKMASVTAKMEA